ncbi:hypothetical protein M3194_14805 [Paenibacillus glycanilyticus]|uniref:hypothetical protein n=1 Tax=Paenibacillus glycanilyticus TaxID=126569 RepID=UPI00203F1EEE|nr:hypothetical protein [Paenibacillus glycanilyticus]MCM3628631.1 hypothetical protein [Paenibacillus glycanilyticus]
MRFTRWMACGIFMVLLVLASMPGNAVYAKSSHGESRSAASLLLSVRTSPSALFEDHIVINDSDFVNAVNSPSWQASDETPRLTDLYISREASTSLLLRVDSSGRLWDDNRRKLLILPAKAEAKLNQAAAALRERHYGKLLDWQEAEKLFSRKAIFVIKDMETGLSFRVQRRAGHDHADVQPVTKADTEIMKQIYNKGWTWDRKAVIAEKDGKQIAASMNGMPHGGDGIPENGFSGHFCVHFLNSSTHKSDAPDLPHQLMVHKAAGMLRPYFADSSPYRLGQSLIEALHHEDPEMVRLLTEGLSSEQSVALLQQKQDWRSIRKKDGRELPGQESLLSEIQLEAEILHATRGKRLLQFHSQFVRTSPVSPWEMKELTIS